MPPLPTKWGRQPALHALREKCDTVAEAARQMGVSYARLHSGLTGRNYPPADLRRHVAKFVGRPERELFTLEVLTSEAPIAGPKPKGVQR